jgi:hypothetical protein
MDVFKALHRHTFQQGNISRGQLAEGFEVFKVRKRDSNVFPAGSIVDECLNQHGDIDIVLCEIGLGRVIKEGHPIERARY